jgi:hypothetical protein
METSDPLPLVLENGDVAGLAVVGGAAAAVIFFFLFSSSARQSQVPESHRVSIICPVLPNSPGRLLPFPSWPMHFFQLKVNK